MNEYDSEGNPPKFVKGDKVLVLPNKMKATVICQLLHYDLDESFWGNLELLYDDGEKGSSHCWQVERIEESTASQRMAAAGYTRRPKGWTKEGEE